jgi:hypothetical protein
VTILSNTFLTFDAKGIREELSDAIYNISPEDTPLMSMASKEKAQNTLFEWQTDSLAAAAANAQLEGDDIGTYSAVDPTARVGNYAQISRKTLIISGTEEAVDKAGRKSELAYQTAKRGVELKRDMEFILFNAQAGVAGNSTTARVTAALNAWVKTNTDVGTGGGDPAYTAGVPAAVRTDGTQRAFTETVLKAVCQALWTAGGELRYLFVGPVNKSKASAFGGVATKNYDLSGKPRPTAIIGAADVYVSDFGYLSILPHRYQRERDAWFIDPQWIAIKHLRPFRREKMAKTGDAEKRMLLVEWGLKVRQEAGLGLAADLTTT